MNAWRLVAGLSALFVSIFFLGIWLVDPPQRVDGSQPQRDAWQLPQFNRTDLKPSIQFLSASTMWGNVQVTKVDEELKDPKWRLLALMRNGAEKFVLLSIENKPNMQLTIGDVLPGGAKIIDIKDDALCLLINGKKRILPIGQQGPTNL